MRPSSAAARQDVGRLTVGYVSGSYHAHPMAYQLVGLLENHDRSRVRAIAYADIHRHDAMTDRVRGSVEQWVDTTGLSDGALAERIRDDGVDVLVFLALHEQGARRALPGHRAAPLQVSLHDIATSGLAVIDGWLTDPLLHPADTSEWFAEPLIRLRSLFLFSAIADAPPVREAADGPIAFASFNNPAKLSAPTLAAWAEILRRVPRSTLLLKYQALFADPAVTTRIRQLFARHGVDPARLRFETGAAARDDHLSLVGSTDIVLDPFPYNGNTATIEALWMGVPVVALRGTRFIGRMSAAILEHIGLARLATDSIADYIDVAIALAADLDGRRRLRTDLRERVRSSRLFDATGYARDVEATLLELAGRTYGRSAG